MGRRSYGRSVMWTLLFFTAGEDGCIGVWSRGGVMLPSATGKAKVGPTMDGGETSSNKKKKRQKDSTVNGAGSRFKPY